MFASIIDIYHRAITNQPLTTHERAMLKAVQGAAIGFLAPIIPQLLMVLTTHGTFNLTLNVFNMLITAFLFALLKLWTAQGDGQVSALLGAFSDQLEQQAANQLTTPADGSALPAVHVVVPMHQAVAYRTLVPLQQSTQQTATQITLTPQGTFVAPSTPPLASAQTKPLPQFVPSQAEIAKNTLAKMDTAPELPLTQSQ